MASVRKACPGQFFTQIPQLVGKVPIHGPGPHTTEFSGIPRHGNGNVAIFAVNPAKSFQLTACSAPDAGCRSLLRRLPVSCWVNDRSSVDMYRMRSVTTPPG